MAEPKRLPGSLAGVMAVTEVLSTELSLPIRSRNAVNGNGPA